MLITSIFSLVESIFKAQSNAEVIHVQKRSFNASGGGENVSSMGDF